MMILHWFGGPRDVLVERLSHFLPTRSHRVAEPWTVPSPPSTLPLWCWLNYCLWRKRLMTCATSCALRFPRGSVHRISLFPLFFLHGPPYERLKRNVFDGLMWNPADWLLTFNWMIERGKSFIHQFLSINQGQETTSSVCLCTP